MQGLLEGLDHLSLLMVQWLVNHFSPVPPGCQCKGLAGQAFSYGLCYGHSHAS